MSTPRIQDGLIGLVDTDSQPDTLFGLPAAPSSVGRESTLLNAPVVAYLVNDKPLHGLLRRIDSSENELLIRQRNLADVLIKFDELRFLVFSHPLETDANSRSGNVQQADQAVAGGGKTFELVFKDGKKFHASAECIFVDHVGVHIFLDKSDHEVCRVFAPKSTLEKYNFDASLGKGLVEHLAVNTDHKEINAVSANKGIIEKGNRTTSSLTPHSSGSQNRQVLSPVTNKDELLERFKHKWSPPSHHLGEILVAHNVISKDQLIECLLYQRKYPGNRFGEILIQRRVAPADQVYCALAFKLGLHFVRLDKFDIDYEPLSLIPRELALRFHLIPLFLDNNTLVVAMSEPTNSDDVKMVEFIARHHIEVVMAGRDDIESAIDKYYRRREDDKLIEEFEIDSDDARNEDNIIREAERQSNEKPIVRLVQNMLIEGIHRKASDIHIRPGENDVEIIFRIDGTLIPVRNFKRSMLAAVVSRIKIIGRMDISERRVPQDGRATINIHNNKIDLRISIMPTINGESVVIRILDTMAGLRSVEELGFDEREYDLFKDMIDHSYGILLVTGPTGSGKSTTLYAALEHIRKSNVNIITAEDPVEYHMEGVEQMQVNHQVGYSFAKILRNILRHDPDVIMVGEIRDQETAKIAIESALTGHLVLSTLHTNSAAVTVTRLLEMGVEPYLINDTLLGVLAQRLVRANCPDCIDVEEVSPAIYRALGIDSSETFYRGKGCENCNHTGYKGRIAVYELLQMNQEIRSHVLKGVNAEVINAEAITNGMTPLTQNAIKAARNRKTSLAEVYRVRLE
jgi:type IV pilus assembly protein PilB